MPPRARQCARHIYDAAFVTRNVTAKTSHQARTYRRDVNTCSPLIDDRRFSIAATLADAAACRERTDTSAYVPQYLILALTWRAHAAIGRREDCRHAMTAHDDSVAADGAEPDQRCSLMALHISRTPPAFRRFI